MKKSRYLYKFIVTIETKKTIISDEFNATLNIERDSGEMIKRDSYIMKQSTIDTLDLLFKRPIVRIKFFEMNIQNKYFFHFINNNGSRVRFRLFDRGVYMVDDYFYALGKIYGNQVSIDRGVSFDIDAMGQCSRYVSSPPSIRTTLGTIWLGPKKTLKTNDGVIIKLT